MLPQLPIKGEYFFILIISNPYIAVGSREAVIDYDFLRGRQNETVVKEICVASAIASETFRFKPTYKMADHGSIEKGINRADSHKEYMELHTVLNEAVAGFAHFYANGISKCTFLAGLTARPIHNLEDVNCPPPDSTNREHWCTLPCRRFPKYMCATKTANSLYDWLMYYLQKKDFVQCSADMTRYTRLGTFCIQE